MSSFADVLGLRLSIFEFRADCMADPGVMTLLFVCSHTKTNLKESHDFCFGCVFITGTD